jgi:predicted Rossmann fold flavoprotein
MPLSANLWDVVVIGAGAAGLLAAVRAAERGKRTLLLEKNRKPGVKILMSGGTRCNLTHATDNRGIVDAYGPPGRFLHSALAAFSVEDTLSFFAGEGVATKVEETGKVFPVSNRATEVLSALLHRLQHSGAQLALAEPVQDLERTEAGFLLTTPLRVVQAGKVILTTGGQSYPGTGTTGDGYHFAARLGHSLVLPRPALVPITTEEEWVRHLRGVTIPDVVVQLVEEGKRLDRRRGSLLFAHFGLSGPVILDISRGVSGHPHPRRLMLVLDLLPEENEAEVSRSLREEANRHGKKQLAGLLPGPVPRRLAEVILDLAGAGQRTAAGLRREERLAIVHKLKHLEIPITGTLGFGKAEVTAGGISLREVDSRTMQSKIVDHFYLAGEVLDLDGPIGGYNFQAAWSTGWLAGSSV